MLVDEFYYMPKGEIFLLSFERKFMSKPAAFSSLLSEKTTRAVNRKLKGRLCLAPSVILPIRN
jgi:hypothetical protein